MKAGWHSKNLGDVCRFIDYRGKTPVKTDNGLRLITAKNVKMGFLQESPKEFVAPESYDFWMTRGIPRVGDVLFTTEAPLANVAQLDTDEKVVFAQRIIILQTKDDSLDNTFLKYYLISDAAQELIHSKGTGATVQGIKASLLKTIPVLVPPLPEQQRIVGILDEAFEGIATAKANAEKNLQNARALFESHLQAVFSQRGEEWVEKRLQDVCAKITDGTHQTPTYFEDGVVFLSSRNVTSGKIDWDNIKYIDTKQHVEMHKRVAPRVDDILLAKNGTTGVAAIVDRDVVFDIYVSLALIRTLGEVSPKFLLYYINSPAAKEQFNNRLKGVGVPNLHLQEIREVLVRFPLSKQKQSAVVAELDTLREETQRLESIYQQKLTALDELKKSLLDQAFTGELTSDVMVAI